MSHQRVAAKLLITLLVLVSIATGRSPSSDQDGISVAAPSERGAVAVAQAIKRLGVIASVLHTGAHPDDENSGLLAYLARSRQARTAYLSLTRGDGGQNLIGPELYEQLGVIRTEELLAARRLDGAQQFFTRVYDFGFSKSRDETLAKWDREAVLSDMVRVIRTFRPLVIASQWSGTPRDGHGHHQSAGVLTIEAYRAAADPGRFPEQIVEGLRPWKVKKLYVSAAERERGSGPEATVRINVGQFDPLLGRSCFEIAMQGRSQHRSQDMGTLQLMGPRFSALALLEPTPGKKERDIFEGLDVSVVGISDFAGSAAARLKPALIEVQKAADEASRRYNPFSPSTIAPIVVDGLTKLSETRASLSTMALAPEEAYEVDFLLAQKQRDFAAALLQLEGVVVDCVADDEVVTPGQTFDVTVTVYANAYASPQSIRLEVPPGWKAEKVKDSTTGTDQRITWESVFKVTVAPDQPASSPYWLAGGRKGDLFVPGRGGAGIEPTSPPLVTAVAELGLLGQQLAISQHAQHRLADKALGEIRRELKVAPPVSVSLSPGVLIFPVSSKWSEQEVSVSVINNAKTGTRGSVVLETPSSWQITGGDTSFDLKREGERASFTFKVSVPPGAREGGHTVLAKALVNGRQYQEGFQLVAYPHIEPRSIVRPASAVARVVDVKVAPRLKVGYIEGSGDDFAAALKRLGVNVKVIDSRELASGDLALYDVIVTGVRVYEVRPDVAANNGRLLEYVRNGGTLIVQYNKMEYAQGNFAPYPIKMQRTIDRVTDERAAITILEPNHPRFNFPNKTTERDFEDWVQERGAYFLSEWDPQFKPLMACNDAGEEPKKGGEVIASYGRGLYVYTAYGWFRQLPEGVPGAYRLIANLVSLPKAPGLRR